MHPRVGMLATALVAENAIGIFRFFSGHIARNLASRPIGYTPRQTHPNCAESVMSIGTKGERQKSPPSLQPGIEQMPNVCVPPPPPPFALWRRPSGSLRGDAGHGGSVKESDPCRPWKSGARRWVPAGSSGDMAKPVWLREDREGRGDAGRGRPSRRCCRRMSLEHPVCALGQGRGSTTPRCAPQHVPCCCCGVLAGFMPPPRLASPSRTLFFPKGLSLEEFHSIGNPHAGAYGWQVLERGLAYPRAESSRSGS